MTSLALTISETLRYRGKIGQWSWVLHRITGLGTLFFLFLHVIDTSWAALYPPSLYNRAISQYQSPLFTFGEFVLVACVVYHAINGFRIVLFDWRPQWWKFQARAANIVLGVTLVLLIPTFGLMFAEMIRHYTGLATFNFDTFKLPEIIADNSRFALGIIALLAFGIIASAIYSVIAPGANAPRKALKRSRFDTFMWTYMRASGVLILPLVFGHLAMMHVIQGVFNISVHNYIPIGTTMINQSGTAVEFVALRWNTMFAGVFVWRVYDILLLILTIIHGFYGMHYALNDYIHNALVNRGAQIAIFATVIGLLFVGGIAILSGVPAETVKMLQQQTAQAAAQVAVK